MKTNGEQVAKDAGGGPPETTCCSSVQFPKDLRVWLKHSALLRATQGIAQETDVTTFHPLFSVRARRFHHPWRMLTLVTFAYATGIPDDRAVAALGAVESDLREVCRGEAPSAGTIRRFRNHNRNVIVSCLGKLIRHVWRHRNPWGTALPPLLIVEILCEARTRVQRAPSPTATNEARRLAH